MPYPQNRTLSEDQAARPEYYESWGRGYEDARAGLYIPSGDCVRYDEGHATGLAESNY